MTIKQKLPSAEVLEKNLSDENVAVTTVYEVCSWRDGPAHSSVPCSEVHLLVRIRGLPGLKVGLRLKSARAIDELVGVLLEYRKEVWP